MVKSDDRNFTMRCLNPIIRWPFGLNYSLARTQLRFFRTKKKQPNSRQGKLLDAPATEKKSKLFAFGNFASLQRPAKNEISKSETVIEKISSFNSLRIFPTVRAAMIKEIKEGYNLKSTYVKSKEELEIKPSPVQVAAIRKINQPRKVSAKQSTAANGNEILKELILENESKKLKVFTVAAETGSGKTWAYLASVFSKLKEDDANLFNRSKKLYSEAKQFETIRAVILLPTHELVDQVYDTAFRASTLPIDLEEDVGAKMLQSSGFKSFLEAEGTKNLGLKVVKWGSGDSHERLFQLAQKGRIDVLVTTPAKIQGLAKLTNIPRQFRLFNFVEYCVVDEADTLMDNSWFPDTSTVLRRFDKLKDLIMCSATIPKEFNKTMKSMFKDENSVISIVTPLVHKIPKQIVVKVIDAQQAPYHGSKSRCLAQALYAIYNDGTEAGYVKRILVFVNEKKDVEPLVETLITKYGHRQADIVAVTGKDSAVERGEKIDSFIRPATLLEDDPDGSKIKVLVTTDLLARGLNFLGIKNVILMDIPRSSVDLIHRVGRTGRMKQSGRVFIIIDKKSKKSWIKGLPRAIKEGTTIG